MPLKCTRAVLCLLFSIALTTVTTYAQRQVGEVRLQRVVIDPGHGGTDPGALSPDRKLREKDINLYVAKKLGEYINQAYPQVEVYYTRTTDVQVALDQRSAFANRKKADLFISIHVNSAGKNTSARGTETFVMGMHKNDSNFEVCLKENSVITLEEDYQTTYQGFEPDNPESYIIFNLMQSASLEQSVEMANFVQKELSQSPVSVNRGIKQGGLLVLWKTTMPAVLVELGFITNEKDRNVLATPAGRDRMAKHLFEAFSQYKKKYESGMTISTDIPVAGSSDSPADARESVANAKGSFAIQVFALSSKINASDSRFKGEKTVNCVRDGNIYKYSVGSYALRSEAEADLPRVKQKFPGAFIVPLSD